MKNLLLIVVVMISAQVCEAQLKATPVCPPFSVDVLSGTVNKLYPKSTLGEIKKTLPCFTDVVELADSAKCAAVSFKDQDIYFYPDRNYFELRENFKGKSTLAIGTNRSTLFSMLGNPKIKDVSWDAFQTEYGTLVLYYDKAGKVNKIQISTKTADTLKLCE